MYLGPVTHWLYFKYGRPGRQQKTSQAATERVSEEENAQSTSSTREGAGRAASDHDMDRESRQQSVDPVDMSGQHCPDERPMFATLMIRVCQSGAGCVFGDMIGEWCIYGIGTPLHGRGLWAEFLVGQRHNFCISQSANTLTTSHVLDYAFAILFAVIFDYFSMALTAVARGPCTIWQISTADFITLTSFEIGLFGWMAIFKMLIFKWQLEMATATYCWMMQIGMFLGHWTASITEFSLIRAGIKKPCA